MSSHLMEATTEELNLASWRVHFNPRIRGGKQLLWPRKLGTHSSICTGTRSREEIATY